MVPRSFSRTTEKAVDVVRMTMRMKAMRPGTRNWALRSSGLYQTRTSVFEGKRQAAGAAAGQRFQRDPLRVALEDGGGVARGRRPAHGVRAVDEELDRGAPPGQEVLGERLRDDQGGA